MSARDEIMTVMKPCAICGGEEGDIFNEWTEEEAAQWITDFARMSPEMKRTMLSLQSKTVCVKCFAKINFKSNDMEKMRSRLEHEGLWPRGNYEYTFEKSSPSVESGINEFAWSRIRHWNPDKGNIWLQGGTGLGKTFAARCIGNRGIECGLSAGDLSVATLCLKANEFDFGQWIKPYTTVSMLILDDIDKGTWNNKSASALWSLINARYEANRTTIITSNSTPERIYEDMKASKLQNPTIGGAIFDRLNSSGKRFDRIILQGESLRKTGVDELDAS